MGRGEKVVILIVYHLIYKKSPIKSIWEKGKGEGEYTSLAPLESVCDRYLYLL